MTYTVVVRIIVVSTISVGSNRVVELEYSLSVAVPVMVVAAGVVWPVVESPVLGPGPTGGTISPLYGSKTATAAQKLFLLSLSRATDVPSLVSMLTLAFVLTPIRFGVELTTSIMLSWQLFSATHCWA